MENHEELYLLLSSKSEKLLEIANDLPARGTGDRSSQGLFNYLIYLSSDLINALEDHRVFGNEEWYAFYQLTLEMNALCSIVMEIINLERINHGHTDGIHGKKLTGDRVKLNLMARDLLRNICDNLVRESMKLPLRCKIGVVDTALYRDDLIYDMFPQNSRGRSPILEDDRIVYLAEMFLNLAGEYRYLKPPDLKDKERVTEYIRARLSEEELDTLENKSVHLKKLFERNTNFKVTASHGEDLKTLHRYISSVCSLIRLGYLIINFNRSHSFLMNAAHRGTYRTRDNGFSPDDFSWFITSFAFYYIDLFFKEGAVLCREVLKDYLRVGEKSLPIPPYRGFHVRPSTLVSRIIRHYGSEMTMIFEGEEYNPASPMDLFRANEKINRKTRKELKEVLIEGLSAERGEDESISGEDLFRKGLSLLYERGSIYIKDMDIFLESREWDESSASPEEMIIETAAKVDTLIMEEKIHLIQTEQVLFRGDTRVLNDLEMLAEGGYGEDREGNNIPLPPGLSYLRREWQ